MIHSEPNAPLDSRGHVREKLTWLAVGVVALLWIKIIAFTLFHAFAILHGKLFRLGKTTLQEVRKQIYRSLICGEPFQFFSG